MRDILLLLTNKLVTYTRRISWNEKGINRPPFLEGTNLRADSKSTTEWFLKLPFSATPQSFSNFHELKVFHIVLF